MRNICKLLCLSLERPDVFYNIGYNTNDPSLHHHTELMRKYNLRYSNIDRSVYTCNRICSTYKEWGQLFHNRHVFK